MVDRSSGICNGIFNKMWPTLNVIILLFSMGYYNLHALVVSKNGSQFMSEMKENTLLQWKQYTDMVRQFQINALKSYPKLEDGTDQFPPPKGSHIVPHPQFSDLLTLETDVEVWVVLDNFVRINIEEQSLTITVEEVYTWTDLSLKQDTDLEYSLNSSYYQFELSERAIWTPQLYPRHAVEYGWIGEEGIVPDNMVQVQPSGENCYMRRVMVYTIPCSVNVKNFPFDEHNCTLTLSQPSSLSYRMKLHPKVEEELQAHTEYYRAHLATTSAEWKLDACDVTVRSVQRAGDPFSMDELILNVRLQRCASFYAIVLVFPCILLNILSLVIFTLAPKDVERENFALTLILTYFVLIIIVVDASPPSGPMIPLLGLYIILSTFIVMITFLMSLALIEIHEHCRVKDRKMGRRTLNLINNRFCIRLFTTKETYKQLVNLYKNAHLQNNSQEAKPLQANQIPTKYLCLAMASHSLRWKVFVKFINFVCFLLTLLAHIVNGVVIMVYMSY